MLSEKTILDNFEIEKILEFFPKSGQKQVVLVQHKRYGKVVLKIVKNQNERVAREIQIVTENNFPNVPKVLEVNTYDIDSQKGLYLFEEYIEGTGLRSITDNGIIFAIRPWNETNIYESKQRVGRDYCNSQPTGYFPFTAKNLAEWIYKIRNTNLI